MAWRAADLASNARVIKLKTDALPEFGAAAATVNANPLPIEGLDAPDFAMPACRSAMTAARRQLDTGLGFVIIDRLNVAERATATKLYWLLMSMTAPLVAQKHHGTTVYDVVVTGFVAEAGNGICASKTRNHQGFHTDNSFKLPPDYVKLFCLKTAMEGGLSGLISFQTIYN